MENAWDCQICWESYDTQSRRPRVLGCGHTLCSVCISEMISRRVVIKCHVCRRKHPASNIDEIPFNYAVESILGCSPSSQSPIIETPGFTGRWLRRTSLEDATPRSASGSLESNFTADGQISVGNFSPFGSPGEFNSHFSYESQMSCGNLSPSAPCLDISNALNETSSDEVPKQSVPEKKRSKPIKILHGLLRVSLDAML